MGINVEKKNSESFQTSVNSTTADDINICFKFDDKFVSYRQFILMKK